MVHKAFNLFNLVEELNALKGWKMELGGFSCY